MSTFLATAVHSVIAPRADPQSELSMFLGLFYAALLKQSKTPLIEKFFGL
jgi:hypothetical protein